MAGEHRDWKQWREFFAARAKRPAPRILEDDPALATLPDSVARSLAIFQLGESGGGTVIEQARRSAIEDIDDDYADAMALFVAEEHRHAELLACCVRALKGELIRGNWTARLFVFGRRLIGLRLKVMVLLAAEVVGICYYRLISRHLPAGEMRELLEEIVEDEKAHLDFHCSFLRTQASSRVRRIVIRWSWRALMLAAAIAVLIDHRAAIRDLSIPLASVWNRWMLYSRAAEDRILNRGLWRLQPAVVR